MSDNKTTTTISNYTSIFKTETAADFVYEGVKNKTVLKGFVKLCRKTQKEMKSYLEKRLKSSGYKNVVNEDGFIYAPGTIPVLVTAHMDTVHKEPVKDFYEYYDPVKETHKIHSPQGIGGDDRCGIYIILRLIDAGFKPYVLFCEDEEIGCVGSEMFCGTKHLEDLKDLKYLIQIDRHGNNDAVFYNCDNEDFTAFIENVTGYKEAWGTCSDISNLAPASGVAAVNLSCGYYHEHHLNEYVILEEMAATAVAVGKLLNEADTAEQYEYISAYRNRGYYSRYDDWYDDYDYYYKKYYKSEEKKSEKYFEALWMDNDVEKSEMVIATTYAEAVGKFLMDHPDLTFNRIIINEF